MISDVARVVASSAADHALSEARRRLRPVTWTLMGLGLLTIVGGAVLVWKRVPDDVGRRLGEFGPQTHGPGETVWD